MIHQNDYRNRAAHVRRSARAHLKEIRAARLARKSDGTDTSDPVEMAFERAELAVSRENTQIIEAAPPTLEEADDINHPADDNPAQLSPSPVLEAPDSVEHAALAELDDDVDLIVASDPPPDVRDPIDSDMTVSDATPLEVPSLQDHTSEQEQFSAQEPSAIAPCEDAQSTELDLEGSDLNSLPGAGPGLVWLLHQCGVTSLAELAQSDSASLSPKLGVVGQILDVSRWIEFAASKAEQ